MKGGGGRGRADLPSRRSSRPAPQRALCSLESWSREPAAATRRRVGYRKACCSPTSPTREEEGKTTHRCSCLPQRHPEPREQGAQSGSADVQRASWRQPRAQGRVAGLDGTTHVGCAAPVAQLVAWVAQEGLDPSPPVAARCRQRPHASQAGPFGAPSETASPRPWRREGP